MTRKLSEKISFVCAKKNSVVFTKEHPNHPSHQNPNANFERKCNIDSGKTICWLRIIYNHVSYCNYSDRIEKERMKFLK